MRKLVTLQTIDKIEPIEGADRIQVATINGWKVVVKKDEFYVGQKVFYFEIDSLLPLERNYFKFLAQRGVTKVKGKEYHRLRTAKLRGQISQGLILPYQIFNINWKAGYDEENQIPTSENGEAPYFDPDSTLDKELEILDKKEGDFSEYFGVEKYEPPLKLDSSGAKLIPFPGFIEKTDEPRIQNIPQLFENIKSTNTKDEWYATEKIDGTSCTIWAKIQNTVLTVGVCSRNYGIEETEGNTYWTIARTPLIEYNEEKLSPIEYLSQKCLEDVRSMSGTNTSIRAIQGEIFGEGIQNNPLNVKGHRFLIFNFIKDGKRLSLEKAIKEFDNMPNNSDLVVPIHDIKLPDTLEDLIKSPDKVSSLVKDSNCKQIEGFVWRNKYHMHPEVEIEDVSHLSFKTVSNEYLLSGHE